MEQITQRHARTVQQRAVFRTCEDSRLLLKLKSKICLDSDGFLGKNYHVAGMSGGGRMEEHMKLFRYSSWSKSIHIYSVTLRPFNLEKPSHDVTPADGALKQHNGCLDP